MTFLKEMKRGLYILVAAAALFAPANLLAQAGDALGVLAKAFASQRSVEATLVQCRSNGGTSVTILVQIVPGSGVRSRVIQPFVYAGIVSVDDGESWRNYDPHENLLRVEKSPVLFERPIEERLRLIKANFVLTLERQEIVAGRETIVVALKSAHVGSYDRRLWIDKETSLILQYEIKKEEARIVPIIKTKSVVMGKVRDAISLDESVVENARVQKSWGPVEVKDGREASEHVGFQPAFPKKFPAGLERQAIHVIGHGQSKFIAVRLTDGMATVAVYLWKPGKNASSEPFGGKYDELGESKIKCRVEGDLPDWVKKELAKAFARLN